MLEKPQNIVILILAIAVGVLLYFQFGEPSQPKTVLSPREAADLALAYINDNLLPEGVKAQLKGDVTEESGLYKLQIEVEGEEVPSYVTKDGKILIPQWITLAEEQVQAPAPATPTTTPTAEAETTLGNFKVSQDEICKEDNKPIIYFFGSTGCPHCQWEHPIVEEVVQGFVGYISFHNNMDSEEDREVFLKYSPQGYVPALVLGCKYFRVGSGERAGEEQETQDLTTLICELTGNQPPEVCE